MKKVFLFSVLATLFLAACSSTKTAESQPPVDQGAIAGPLPEPANNPSTPNPAPTTPEPAPSSTTTTTTTTNPAPVPSTSTPQPATDYPKGIPVAGKKGYVLSPYAQYAGLVDVSGFPPGSVVSCPYTHKKFIVP